eukprot:4688212-Prorocentrum_lima.AAC.1
MTSSLVGSEMCIRDRSWRDEHTLDDPLTLMEDEGKEPTTGKRGEGYAPCAVSYTHLTLPTICSV